MTGTHQRAHLLHNRQLETTAVPSRRACRFRTCPTMAIGRSAHLARPEKAPLLQPRSALRRRPEKVLLQPRSALRRRRQRPLTPPALPNGRLRGARRLQPPMPRFVVGRPAPLQCRMLISCRPSPDERQRHSSLRRGSTARCLLPLATRCTPSRRSHRTAGCMASGAPSEAMRWSRRVGYLWPYWCRSTSTWTLSWTRARTKKTRRVGTGRARREEKATDHQDPEAAAGRPLVGAAAAAAAPKGVAPLRRAAAAPRKAALTRPSGPTGPRALAAEEAMASRGATALGTATPTMGATAAMGATVPAVGNAESRGRLTARAEPKAQRARRAAEVEAVTQPRRWRVTVPI
mmetsp:Transcript_121534/g.343836  ORF Transcript_121534/g.343836 Transcript_121534/m.343836 type:complete len:347 (+) Transcript_121534:1391-2431(+)